MTQQDIAEVLTGYARVLTKDDRYKVEYVPGQPPSDWAGAIGHDAFYRLTHPLDSSVNFGTDKSSLSYLKARVRKAVKK